MAEKTPSLRQTRADCKVHFEQKTPTSALYTKSPLSRGCALWNNLGDYYQKSLSKLQFKERLKTCKNLSIVNKNPANYTRDDELIGSEDSIELTQ